MVGDIPVSFADADYQVAFEHGKFTVRGGGKFSDAVMRDDLVPRQGTKFFFELSPQCVAERFGFVINCVEVSFYD